jgi:alanine dehydrogenase
MEGLLQYGQAAWQPGRTSTGPAKHPSDGLRSKTQPASPFKGGEPVVHHERAVRALERLGILCYDVAKPMRRNAGARKRSLLTHMLVQRLGADHLEELDNMFGAHIQTLVSSDSNIERVLRDADLVIGSVLIPGGSTPKLFKRKYLSEMKDGAVFVDVAIDQGGCGESSRVTTHDDPVYTEEGVVHYCVGNMPGAVPRTSTIALTNATLKYGLEIAGKGLEKAAADNIAIALGVNCYLGKLTNKNVADAHGYEYKNLDNYLD